MTAVKTVVAAAGEKGLQLGNSGTAQKTNPALGTLSNVSTMRLQGVEMTAWGTGWQEMGWGLYPYRLYSRNLDLCSLSASYPPQFCCHSEQARHPAVHTPDLGLASPYPCFVFPAYSKAGLAPCC